MTIFADDQAGGRRRRNVVSTP